MSAAAARIAQARRKQRVQQSKEVEDDVLQRSQRIAGQAAQVLASARKAPPPSSVSTPPRSGKSHAVAPPTVEEEFDNEDDEGEVLVTQPQRKETGSASLARDRSRTGSTKNPKTPEQDDRHDATCIERNNLIHFRHAHEGYFVVASAGDDNNPHQTPVSFGDSFQATSFALIKGQASQSALRYFDVIQLQASVPHDSNTDTVHPAPNLFLGTRATAVQDENRSSTDQDQQYMYTLSLVTESCRWMVLPPSHTVALGETGIPHTASSPQHFVRSGHAILLRHMSTGGILTIMTTPSQRVARLVLVTDSFARTGSNVYDPHVLPVTSNDMFVLRLAHVPPLPLWMHQRPYLNGSYLVSQSNRNDAQQQTRKALISPRHRRLFLDHSGVLQAQRKTQLESNITTWGQEVLLRNELMGAFLGLEGDYIRIAQSETTNPSMHRAYFELQEGEEEGGAWDPTLRRLVTEMLPLANHFIHISYFCATRLPGYEYGLVHQAFCEALDGLLHEYMVFIANMEQEYLYADGTSSSQDLLLRRLQVRVQPSLHILSVMERAITTIHDTKGGALLNALRHLKVWTYEGDVAAAAALQIMLEKASVPYFEMLNQWLENGILSDPYQEFMVRCDDRKAWEHKFELVEEHVLDNFYSTPVTVGRALAAGKYWNAVHHCQPDGNDTTSTATPIDVNPVRPLQSQRVMLHYNLSVGVVSSFVQTMYYKASQALQRLLMNEYDLMGSLRLVKRYFLLDQGDFFVNFLDAAEHELLKELSTVSRGRVQHWLESAAQLIESDGDTDLFSSSRRGDSRRLKASALRCRFVPQSLADHLDKLHAATGGIDTFEPSTPQRHAYGGMKSDGITGLDAFVVDFVSIPFPISLVLSRQTIASYQLLFRHLFFSKHVERRLVHIWQDHQAMKELQGLRGSFGPTFLLRQRMVHFMQQLIIYMLFEVIEPKWIEMEQELLEAASSLESTTDDVLDIHNEFLQKVLEACFLTNREVVRALTKLMATCLMFSDQMRRFMDATNVEQEQRQIAIEKQNAIKQNLFKPKSSSHKALHNTLQDARTERLQRVQRNTIRVERELSSESYQRMIARFDEVFSNNLRDFMVQLMRSDDLLHHHKVNLIACIDYNGFVSKSLGLR